MVSVQSSSESEELELVLEPDIGDGKKVGDSGLNPEARPFIPGGSGVWEGEAVVAPDEEQEQVSVSDESVVQSNGSSSGDDRWSDAQDTLSSLFVCLFVLRFYGPVNPMGSCRARSVYLTTRLLGRLSPLSG